MKQYFFPATLLVLLFSAILVSENAQAASTSCYENSSIPQNVISGTAPYHMMNEVTNKQLIPALKACKEEIAKQSKKNDTNRIKKIFTVLRH